MAIYFQCIKEAERQLCGKYILAKSFERFGLATFTDGSKNYLDAAAMTAAILTQQADPNEMHIDNYFWGDNDM